MYQTEWVYWDEKKSEHQVKCKMITVFFSFDFLSPILCGGEGLWEWEGTTFFVQSELNEWGQETVLLALWGGGDREKTQGLLQKTCQQQVMFAESVAMVIDSEFDLPLFLEWITEFLTSQSFPAFWNTPKLFTVLASRGHPVNRRVKTCLRCYFSVCVYFIFFN